MLKNTLLHASTFPAAAGLSLSLSLSAQGNSATHTHIPAQTEVKAKLGVAAVSADHDYGEEIPASEAQATQIALKFVKAKVEGVRDSEGKSVRFAHPKAHGCVEAQFTVANDLPEWAKTSVFQPGADYRASVRFSNGANDPDYVERTLPDGRVIKVGDPRGMAVKLHDVAGQKLLEDAPSDEMDFVMINHPVFFTRDAMDYTQFLQASAAGKLPAYFADGRGEHFTIVQAIQGKRVTNPLAERYFSMSAYGFGKEAAKFSAKPCSGQEFVASKTPESDNMLREAMVEQLAKGGVCFEFGVQRRSNPASMPIENPMVDWPQSASAYVTVARLTIEKQSFDTPEMHDLCEKRRFSPWHANIDHRPLGINRMRKRLYSAGGKLRNDINDREKS